MSEEDVKKNKEMVEAFQRGDTSLMDSDKTQTFPRKESLAPPPTTTCTWKEYIHSEKYDIFRPAHLFKGILFDGVIVGYWGLMEH